MTYVLPPLTHPHLPLQVLFLHLDYLKPREFREVMGNPKEQSYPSFPEKNSSVIRILTVTLKNRFQCGRESFTLGT